MSFSLRKTEWGTAILLTVTLVWLHLLAAMSAGALWRDEANTVGLASLPSIRDVWAHLQYDSFPMLWVLIVRCVASLVGPMNDPAFRAFTFCVGLAVVGMLWMNARAFRQSFPLVSLALFAMSPNFIRFGDTMRGYGFGIALALLTCALLWKFVERPTGLGFALAAVAAIAGVNVLFYDAVLLLAFCAGGVAVCAIRRQWRIAALVILVGVLAAVSMAPYATMIRGASEWNGLVRIANYDFAYFWKKLGETVNVAGPWALATWTIVVVLAVAGGIWSTFSSSRGQLSQSQREVALFALVSLVVGAPAIFLFLRALSYVTAPWYYFALLALVAVCADAVLGAVIKSPGLRIVRLAAVLLIAAATIIPARRAARTRLTDVDVIASHLNLVSRPGDVVLVAPWAYSISFSRYYRGTASWMSIPPLREYGFHRYDLVKEQMDAVDQTMPVRSAIEQAGNALRSGHRVFIAGVLMAPASGPPILLPPASRARGLYEFAYDEQWISMVGYFLKTHASRVDLVPIEVEHVVNPLENLPLRVATGWHP
jgi:hypothetical protein